MKNIFKKFQKNPVAEKDQAVVKELVEEGNSHLRQLQQIDQEISTIQRSTKTTFSFFSPVHNYCRTKYSWYYNWHTKPFATKIHAGVLMIMMVSSLAVGYLSFFSRPTAVKAADFTCTFNESMGNDWDTTDNWTDCGGEYPGATPTTSYDVVIPASTLVYLNEWTDNLDLTAGGIAGGSISISGTLDTDGYDITVLSMTINSGGALTAYGNSTITVKGNWDSSAGTVNVNTSTVNITGDSTIITKDWAQNFYNLKTAYTGKTITWTGNGVIVRQLQLDGDNTASIVASSPSYGPVMSGNGSGYDLITSNGATFGSTARVLFIGANAVIPGNISYPIVDFAASDTTQTLAGNVTTSGLVAIYGGTAKTSTLDLNGYTLTVGGDLRFGAGYTNTRYGKIVNNSQTTDASLVVNGALNIPSTDVADKNILDASGSGASPHTINISVAKNWTNAGVFTAGASNVTFTGNASAHQTITTDDQAFYKLTLNNTQATYDDIIISGALDIDNKLTITDGDLDLNTNDPNTTIGGGLEFTHATNGSITRGTGDLTFDGAGTWTDNGTTKRDLGIVLGTAAVTLGSNVKASYASMTSIDISGYSITLTSSDSFKPISATTLTYNSSSEIIYTASSGNIRLPKYTNPSITINGGSGLTLSPDVEGTEPVIEGNLTITSGVFTTEDVDMVVRDLTVNTNLTIGASGTLTADSSTITVGGNWTNSGTFTANSSTVTFNGTSVSKTINPGSSSFNILTINGSGGEWTLDTNHLTTTTLNITAGALNTGTLNLTVTGATTLNGGNLIGGAGTMTFNSTGVGDFTISSSSSTFTASATVNMAGQGLYIRSSGTANWTTNNSTFNYALDSWTRHGEWGVYDDIPPDTYNNLKLWDNTTYQPYFAFSGDTTINGNLTITNSNLINVKMTTYNLAIGGNLNLDGDSDCSLSTTTGNISIAGNWANAVIGCNFNYGSGTVLFTKGPLGQTQTVDAGGEFFNNLTHSGAGTLQLANNGIDINGNFENSAGVFDANDLNVNVAKNWTISGGSFSPKVGGGATTQTVTFDSINPSTISGSTTFNNLNIDSSGSTDGKTVNFASGSTQSIPSGKTLTLTGALGKVLTLARSGGTSGDHWNLALPGDMTSGEYINVSDNNVTGGTITPGSYVNVINGGNNIGWNWDTVAPTLTITKNPASPNGANGWYITSAPVITITADDGSGIGVDKIYYRWGGTGSYTEYTVALTAPEGSNALYSYATDLAGNSGVDSPDIEVIKVDLTAPDVTSITPFATTPTNNLAVTFHWTEATDASSGIDNYLVYIGSTTGGTDIENGTATTSNSFSKTFSSVGTYYIKVKAKDLAGNTSGSFSGEGSVLIETDPPAVAITNLADNQYVNTKEFTILGTASDAIAGLSRVYIAIDSGSWIETSSSDGYNNWSYSWSGYADGLHTIKVKATDASGNTKETTTYAVTVDTLAPTQASGFRLFNVSNSFAKVYTTYLDFAGSADDTSGVKIYELWKGNAKLADIPTAKDSTNPYYSGNEKQSYFYLDPDLSPSSYSYYIKAIDNAGHSSQTPALTIDTAGKTIETDAITEAKGTPSSVVTKQKTSALISWNTVYPSTSTVEYGESTNYGQKTEVDTNLNLGHSVLIPDLKPATIYHAKVLSRDIYGRELVSPDFTFQTGNPPDDKTVLQIIIESLQNLFRAVTAQGAPPTITTGTPTTEELSSLQGFSNNLMVTDVSFPDKNYYTNILTFEKGKTPERSTDGSSYQTLPTAGNNYILDRDLVSATTYYYRLDQGNPIVRKPALGDDSPLSIKDASVIKESVMSGKDKAQLTVYWTTNRGSTSSVEFGTSLAYGQKTKEDASLNMGHNVLIEDLAPDSIYHFKVTSTDAQGSTATSSDFTYQTPSAQTEKSPIDIIIEAFNKVFSTIKSIF